MTTRMPITFDTSNAPSSCGQRTGKRFSSITVCFILLVTAMTYSGPAKADVGPLFAQEMAALPPDTAMERIDREIIEISSQQPLDAATVVSLLELKAEILRDDNPVEAADVLVQLAQFVARNRELLDTDPGPLFRDAARLYREAERLRDASAALQALLNLLIEEKAEAERRIEVLRHLAAIAAQRGDSAAQTTYENAITEIQNPRSEDQSTRGSDEPYVSVKVHYATDRAPTGLTDPARFFGAGRADLQYGSAVVTIPASHASAQLEAPSIWKLEFSESSDKHIILKSVEPTPEEAFFQTMREGLAERDADEAFVFVHGFNVSFEKAVKRTAQLAHDMGFAGAPITYSWPSHASVLSYVADTAVVRLSGRRLARFLEDVVARSGAKRIHVIAHSMGNRALTDALELIGTRRQANSTNSAIFDQVIFAAPDVDAGLFAEMAQTFRPLARRLTLYASRNDWALKVSRKLHGDAQRAGQGGDETLVSAGIDSVDMSELGGDMLAHGYFADDSSALVDLVSLFWRNLDPAGRCGLERVDTGSMGGFWRYKPELCDDQVMLPLLSAIRARNLSGLRDVQRLIRDLVQDETKLPGIESMVGRMSGD